MRTRRTRSRGAARLARILGLDGNPLRRASDRAEAWIRIGLLAAFLVAGPLAAVGAGHWAYHSGISAVRAEVGPRHSVRTVLLPPASPAYLAPAGRGVPDTSGQPATAAPQPGQTALVAVLMTLVLVALALLVVLRLTQRLLNRRRLAAWGAAWSAIGPQWTGRAP